MYMIDVTVSKLIRYDDPTTYGKWRNRLTFGADDGDFGGIDDRRRGDAAEGAE